MVLFDARGFVRGFLLGFVILMRPLDMSAKRVLLLGVGVMPCILVQLKTQVQAVSVRWCGGISATVLVVPNLIAD